MLIINSSAPTSTLISVYIPLDAIKRKSEGSPIFRTSI